MTQANLRMTGRSGGAGKPWARALLWSAGGAVSALVASTLYFAAARTVEDDARLRFDNVTRAAQYSLSARIRSYTDVVRGIVALFRTQSEPITRLQFHRYVEGLDLAHHFPAIETLNYAELVPDSRRDAFIAAVRADRSVVPQGYPDFSIKPPGRRPDYTVLTYMEPMLGEKFGVDISVSPAIARALAEAHNAGAMAASGQPIIVKAPLPHLGLGMRMPIYRGGVTPPDLAGRRAAYLGSVGVGFAIPALVQTTLDEMALRQIHLTLYADASRSTDQRSLVVEADDKLLFNDNGSLEDQRTAAADDFFETVLPVDFNGALWKAQFRVRKGDLYSGFDHFFPALAFVVGAAGSMLVYAYFLTLFWSRRGAIEQRLLLDTVLDSIDAHVYMKDRDRRYLYINARTAAAMNRSAEEVIGRID
jgi:CHASE1-domain containing sensor protein